MKLKNAKRKIALLLGIALCMGALTGCRYNSLDEYLESLGLKDPEYIEPSFVEETSTAEMTYAVSQDATIGSAEFGEISPQAAEEPDYSDVSSMWDSQGIQVPEGADAGFTSSYRNISAEDLDADMKAGREAMGLTPESIKELKEQQKGLYAYERLTDSGKTLYVELLTIMQKLGENILVSTTSDDAIDLVFDYVLADHPEIFYVDGYHYTNYTLDSVITKIAFSGNYIYNADEIRNRQSLINEYASQCLAGAPASDDDFYAIKYVYDYIITNTEYDVNAPDNQNICSVFIDGRSVCSGYSKAAQFLLNKLGIPCTLVSGTVTTKKASNVRHAWNLVLCNSAYYYMDVTWGDSSYQTGNGENADLTKLPTVNYDYLCVTTDEILRNHTIADRLAMPYCDSMKDNYYVREDEYFTSADLTLVGELFDRRYRDDSENVVIKCDSRYVYDTLFELLVTQRMVFDYLQGDNATVSYTTFADTYTLIFWIR